MFDQTYGIKFCFQHFPSLSRNQDHDGNNTPASDDRPGRNFHLPNICRITDFSAIVLFHFDRIFFFFVVVCTDPPMLIILRDDQDNNSKNINQIFIFFLFLENSSKFDGHNWNTIFNCSYNIK
jgi:hypothetical protein